MNIKREGNLVKVDKIILFENRKSVIVQLVFPIITGEYEVTGRYEEEDIGIIRPNLDGIS